MAFAVDADLLRLEPGLLGEVSWTGQLLTSLDDVLLVNGGTRITRELTVLASAGVGLGSVGLFGDVPVEVLGAPDQTSLDISLIRPAGRGDARRLVGVASPASWRCWTYAPQIEWAHRELLRALGLGVPGDPLSEEGPGAVAVLNDLEAAHVESMGALWRVYSAATPRAGEGSPIAAKASAYGAAFSRAVRGFVARLDVDGGGVAGAVRAAGAAQLRRV